MSTLERADAIEEDFYHLKAQEWACEKEEAELVIKAQLAAATLYFRERRT